MRVTVMVAVAKCFIAELFLWIYTIFELFEYSNSYGIIYDRCASYTLLKIVLCMLNSAEQCCAVCNGSNSNICAKKERTRKKKQYLKFDQYRRVFSNFCRRLCFDLYVFLSSLWKNPFSTVFGAPACLPWYHMHI